MIKLALPGGDLRGQTAALLSSLGLHSQEYVEGSRAYRFPLGGEETHLRVFREKDIPIQIALGNYDLGICNRTWLDELIARYPQQEIVALRPLGYGDIDIVAAAAPKTLAQLGAIERWPAIEGLRIVTEYPNLAEAFAMAARFPRYQIIPVWGAAPSYPPEDADLAVFAETGEVGQRHGLTQVARLTSGSAWLLANRTSLAAKDLSAVLGPLLRQTNGAIECKRAALPVFAPGTSRRRRLTRQPHRELRLALPDGHAQRHTHAALAAAGLSFEGYEENECVPRPKSDVPGLSVKVIRPQDMAQHVALGSFDLAITGRDWLMDHRTAFPSSPVREVADLRRSRYSLSVVVDERLPGDDLGSVLAHWRSAGHKVIRIASEYANLADHFARQHHIGRYQIIPVSGASEGFVPEDCEILLEGTETGTSVAANRLKVIHRLFESTNCLIAGPDLPRGASETLFEWLVERLRRSVAASA